MPKYLGLCWILNMEIICKSWAKLMAMKNYKKYLTQYKMSINEMQCLQILKFQSDCCLLSLIGIVEFRWLCSVSFDLIYLISFSIEHSVWVWNCIPDEELSTNGWFVRLDTVHFSSFRNNRLNMLATRN